MRKSHLVLLLILLLGGLAGLAGPVSAQAAAAGAAANDTDPAYAAVLDGKISPSTFLQPRLVGVDTDSGRSREFGKSLGNA